MNLFQKFFGKIRSSGGQNDSPTFNSFSQLYSLLSVYNVLKPPKFGNCTVDLKDSNENKSDKLDEDFCFFLKTNNVDYEKSYKAKYKKQFEEGVQNFVEDDIWDNDSECYLGKETSEAMTDNAEKSHSDSLRHVNIRVWVSSRKLHLSRC